MSKPGAYQLVSAAPKAARRSIDSACAGQTRATSVIEQTLDSLMAAAARWRLISHRLRLQARLARRRKFIVADAIRTRRTVIGGAFGVAAVLVAVPAWASPSTRQLDQQTAAPGSTVGLSGTPHLWFADDTGVLHWGGDTRALADKAINWSDRRDVTLDQLRAYKIGDPWLSAGLIKIGEPIYLVKWEANQDKPTLLHIQSIQDVEIFGINGGNYGTYVLDQGAWETQFGMSAGSLARGVLQSAVPPVVTPTPNASPTRTPTLRADSIKIELIEGGKIRNTIEVTGATPGRRLKVTARYTEWICSPGCDNWKNDKWGPTELAAVPVSGVSAGKFTFVNEHNPYRSYSFTFEDVSGDQAVVNFTQDDRVRFSMG
jgi:hypothetical protein